MLEIEGKDISELSDSDLRSLVGLLCEADLQASGLPIAGVTWGGHQNAKDGGIDVRVELTTALHNDGFVPRAKTGFQVKKPDMARANIINEMKPKGKLRSVIKELIDAKGAYIIVSSQGSTADSALKDRKKAMEEALVDCPNSKDLKVDFYDRERIAGWVRSHPALVLWVRERIGNPIQGWQGYDNWANCPNGIEEEYVFDEHIRLYNNTKLQEDGSSAIDGINEIRNMFHLSASAAVRLVGLSGVGKTRLLQALFDGRIGEKSLHKSSVFYTDISDSPDPEPTNFARRLIALRKSAILAIDNCPPDLHKRLKTICSVKGSKVSLITVEYDVREDQPEDTEVILLEPASTELIEKILLVRFSHLTEVGARTIANFSGGNARIAIALGGTVKRGENLLELRDSDLFDRLFQQRNEPSRSLMRAAEACSLVYSFNNQVPTESNAELEVLGSLVDMGVQELHSNVSELKRRNLVQQRGIWRAVLPHAIANKLARRAFENIPINIICDVFEKRSSERLLKSFSKRLSYLHKCEGALEVSRKWFLENGLLEDVSNLNRLGVNLLENIAPLNPELTLSAIERVAVMENAHVFYSRENIYYSDFTRILRSLAYEEKLFIRAAELLCRFALSEKPKENYNSIRELLKSLFYIYLSGTHATAEQRLSIIQQLVESNVENEVDLGIFLLDAALEAWHFSSHYNFEFGAHSRDYGFRPRNNSDIQPWYRLFIEYTANIAVSERSAACKAKNLLANKFSGLWIKVGIHDALEAALKNIATTKGSWNEGWLAVRTTMVDDSEEMDPEDYKRLNDLDKILRPTALIERARLYVFSNYSLELVESDGNQDEDEYLVVEEVTRSLGKEISSQEHIFKEMLPEILSNDSYRLFYFGQGLAEGCADPEKMWQAFCNQLSIMEVSQRKYQVLCGFLDRISEIDKNISEKILEEATTNAVLATVYPLLQRDVKMNAQGVVRLKRSLEYGMAPIWQYSYLGRGRAYETIFDADLLELLREISLRQGGVEVAIDILDRRIRSYTKRNLLSRDLQYLGRELVLKYSFSRKDTQTQKMDYELAYIIDLCFADESAIADAKVLCENLVKSLENYDISSNDYEEVLNAISKNQPLIFLDIFLERGDQLDYWIKQALARSNGPISKIKDSIITNWCKSDLQKRGPILASSIIPFQQNKHKNTLEWSTLALWIIDNFNDPLLILNQYYSTFWPRSWSGSLAKRLESRLSLLSDLKEHENVSIVDWARKVEIKFKADIRSEKEREFKQERERNERFE
ncbi:hypothetical protein ACIQYX_26330 [Bacillus toyonensis]|uniref:hypothetical protein n=1 Tax=Bacillus toyonensis TaxID=155322 RepID=UPI0038133E52